MKKLLITTVLLLIFGLSYSQVKVYEGQEVIPTYQKGPDVVSPLFYTGRGVQGAAGHMYPYPAQTSLSDTLTMVTYDMVYLENEYLKVTILPAFGGKIFSAIDKTNGHELFHRNSVIKPDLIGTLGAWISGGVEWCFPNHHRTTTLMPADYTIERHEDGSATVWVGETERSRQLRGIIGITLFPGRSYIQAEYHLTNTNVTTENFLFWANVAVTADKNFRTFWPPSQEIGVFHSNTSFTEWPISHEVYHGIDYTKGVDLTWWKNHPDPVSFFFWQGNEGFIGGYDYSQNAGTVHVGDKYINRTSKLWQFGPGLQGQNARRKLTDDGKAYVELMTGTYSNNQPDYSWFAPNAVKEAKNYWYPVRDLEIVKNANTDASVTLQMKDAKTVFYGFNTTAKYDNARALLKYDGKILSSQTISIDPAHPFTSTFKSKDELDEYKLYAALLDKNGNELISYVPYKPQHPALPEVQAPPKLPKEIESVEDLYLTGRYVEQFSRPGVNADEYYLEALRKSPDDYRVNMAMGIRRVNQWRFEEAQSYLQRAADKLKAKYVQPKEGDLYYYSALAEQGLGNDEEAYRDFYQATWYYAWYSPSYYQLALMESSKGNYSKALEFVENAYSTNTRDGRINVLYAALLRKQGQKDEALDLINRFIKFDPLNFAARYEKELLLGQASLKNWQKNMQDIDNDYLEVAVSYLNAGMTGEGIKLLSEIEKPKNPLVFYYLSWFYDKDGQPGKALTMLKNASALSLDYCFPYRQETLAVLKHAIAKDPGNASAYYLAGNLLFDRRPEEAMEDWNKAAGINDHFPMVWRNLAFGEFHFEHNTGKAITYIEKAISQESSQPIWYAELADYYDQSDKDFRDCLSLMEKHIDVVKQDISAPKELVRLYNLNGEYDKAIDLLKTHHFRTWEGGRDIYYHYVDAHTLKAMELMEEKKYQDALDELNTAMLYPENLEVGKPLNDDRNAMIYYFMGKAREKMKDKNQARADFEKSVNAINARNWDDLLFYQAKSLEALGNQEKAKELYNQLLSKGTELLTKGVAGSGVGVEASLEGNRTISEAYYLQALGSEGLGRHNEASELLKQALSAYRNNLWAKQMIDHPDEF